MKLSPTMQEALARVPDDWEGFCFKPRFRLRNRWVRSVLFHPTFGALRTRKLIEYRGGPGTWEWRKVPAASRAAAPGRENEHGKASD